MICVECGNKYGTARKNGFRHSEKLYVIGAIKKSIAYKSINMAWRKKMLNRKELAFLFFAACVPITDLISPINIWTNNFLWAMIICLFFIIRDIQKK